MVDVALHDRPMPSIISVPSSATGMPARYSVGSSEDNARPAQSDCVSLYFRLAGLRCWLRPGFLLTPRATHSVVKRRIDSWHERGYALLDGKWSSFPDMHPLDLAHDRKLRAAPLIASSAIGSGNLSEAARFTVERALRANVPNVAVALAGSLISTVESVLSAVA